MTKINCLLAVLLLCGCGNRPSSPDIIAFQEVRVTSEEEAREIVADMLGGDWHSARQGDTVTVSRYPIVMVRPIGGNLGALIDLPDEKYARDIWQPRPAGDILPGGGRPGRE
ncbi:MAG: hypothetical protein V1789_00665 [PVC group bacterium]